MAIMMLVMAKIMKMVMMMMMVARGRNEYIYCRSP